MKKMAGNWNQNPNSEVHTLAEGDYNGEYYFFWHRRFEYCSHMFDQYEMHVGENKCPVCGAVVYVRKSAEWAMYYFSVRSGTKVHRIVPFANQASVEKFHVKYDRYALMGEYPDPLIEFVE